MSASGKRYALFFGDSANQITIQNADGVTFTCPSNEFPSYEPEYSPLVAPIVTRYWAESHQYVSDGTAITDDPYYTPMQFAKFVARIPAYQVAYNEAHPAPEIPEETYPALHVLLSITGGDGKSVPAMYPNKSTATLKFLSIDGKIVLNPADESSIIPVTYTWRVSVYNVHRERFKRDKTYFPIIKGSYPLEIQVVNGLISMPSYSYKKEGIYMICDDAFDLVDGSEFGKPGVMFQVKLVGGEKFFKVIE